MCYNAFPYNYYYNDELTISKKRTAPPSAALIPFGVTYASPFSADTGLSVLPIEKPQVSPGSSFVGSLPASPLGTPLMPPWPMPSPIPPTSTPPRTSSPLTVGGAANSVAIPVWRVKPLPRPLIAVPGNVNIVGGEFAPPWPQGS